MFFQRLYTSGLAINSYIIGDAEAKVCALVDPPRLIAPCIAAVQNAGLTLTDIIETHVHADFVSGSVELKSELDGKPCIHASGMGGPKWTPSYADLIVKDGDILQIGHIRLQALHTPGHTPEHLIWVCYDERRNKETPWFAFTGDLLFVGGVGRPDLLGPEAFEGLAKQLYHTLFEKLAIFPDYMEIFPCHAAGSLCGTFFNGRYSSTLGYERLFNPFLIKKEESLWIESIRQEFTQFPNEFRHIKQLNAQGPPLMESLSTLAAEGSLDDLDLEALFLIDTRNPLKFAEFHLKGSINIPMHDSFCHWCSWLVPQNISLGLIVEDHFRDGQIVGLLRLIGFDQPVLLISLPRHIKMSVQGDSFPILSVNEAAQKLGSAEICIIDVRSPAEWKSGHIPGALHIELQQLEGAIDRLPRDLPVATICRSGMRASIAASILQKGGCQKVANIQGGMEMWISAGLPLEEKDEGFVA